MNNDSQLTTTNFISARILITHSQNPDISLTKKEEFYFNCLDKLALLNGSTFGFEGKEVTVSKEDESSIFKGVGELFKGRRLGEKHIADIKKHLEPLNTKYSTQIAKLNEEIDKNKLTSQDRKDNEILLKGLKESVLGTLKNEYNYENTLKKSADNLVEKNDKLKQSAIAKTVGGITSIVSGPALFLLTPVISTVIAPAILVPAVLIGTGVLIAIGIALLVSAIVDRMNVEPDPKDRDELDKAFADLKNREEKLSELLDSSDFKDFFDEKIAPYEVLIGKKVSDPEFMEKFLELTIPALPRIIKEYNEEKHKEIFTKSK